MLSDGMPPPVFETDRLRYARGKPHVLAELSAVVRGGHGEGRGGVRGSNWVWVARGKRNKRALHAGLAGQT